MLKSKIQRVRVTASDMDYEGSITVDEILMDTAGIMPYELVHVLNLSNGSGAETYVIKGKKNSGDIILNGAIARLAQVGDPLIILSYSLMEEDQAKMFTPTIVFVDDNNRIKKVRS